MKSALAMRHPSRLPIPRLSHWRLPPPYARRQSTRTSGRDTVAPSLECRSARVSEELQGMPGQQIIWTALPNGRKPNGASETLMLSVVASPRLKLDDGGTGVLQSFPDLVDWPAHVGQSLTGIDLFVDDDEAHPISTTIIAESSTAPDPSDLWKALFAPTTPVRSQQFQGFQQPVATYSVSGVAAQLQAGYTSLAHDAPFRPADMATFKQSFANLVAGPSPSLTGSARAISARLPEPHAASADELAEIHRELSTALLSSDGDASFDEKLAGLLRVAGVRARSAPAGEHVPLVADTGHPGATFAEFAAFHRRPVGASRSESVNGAAQPTDAIDFHRALTALGEYSWLMRRLRLVFDLEVDTASVPTSSIGALRRIRVEPRFSSPSTAASSYTPFTKYILDNDTKRPLAVSGVSRRAAGRGDAGDCADPIRDRLRISQPWPEAAAASADRRPSVRCVQRRCRWRREEGAQHDQTVRR